MMYSIAQAVFADLETISCQEEWPFGWQGSWVALCWVWSILSHQVQVHLYGR